MTLVNVFTVVVLTCAFSIKALPQQVYQLNWEKPYNKSHYEFLKTLAGDKSVVQLGESIHMTDEFPRVRLQLIRYLHEELGFDVLAFEGSWIQSWLAQDALYKCKANDLDCIKEAQQLAWFPLWQTDEMRGVLEYVMSTQATAHPLYLASFDVETGSDAKFQGSGTDALSALFKLLQHYGANEDRIVFDRWNHALAPFSGCFPQAAKMSDSQRHEALVADSELRALIKQIAFKVRPRAHASVLESIPDALAESVELCSLTPGSPLGGSTYQELRDQFNAMNVITLRDIISRNHRVIVWAHVSHVRQNWSVNLSSMGQRLKAMIGPQLYTIAVFAGGGEAIAVDDQSDPPFHLRTLGPINDFDFEKKLAIVNQNDFLIDFSGLPNGSQWGSIMSFEDENGTGHFIPAEVASALIFIHKVHAPEPFASQLRSHGQK